MPSQGNMPIAAMLSYSLSYSGVMGFEISVHGIRIWPSFNRICDVRVMGNRLMGLRQLILPRPTPADFYDPLPALGMDHPPEENCLFAAFAATTKTRHFPRTAAT